MHANEPVHDSDVPNSIAKTDIDVAKVEVLKAKQLHGKAETAMRTLHESLVGAMAALSALDAERKTCKDAYEAAVDSVVRGTPIEVQKSKQDIYAKSMHRVEILNGVYAERIRMLVEAKDDADSTHAEATSAGDFALEIISKKILKKDTKEPTDSESVEEPAAEIPEPEPAEAPADAAEELLPSGAAVAPAEPTFFEVSSSTIRRMSNNPTDSDFTYVDPFWELPLVQAVPTANDLDFATYSIGESKNSNATVGFVFDYRFDRPAEFPLMSFGINGERSDERGAVIYEGMRLAIRDDGRYQVRFVVGTPSMPVEMDLQFVLRDDQYREYTLTLPPIRIPEQQKPVRTSERQPVNPVYAATRTIHHEGYLPVLAEAVENIRIVRRTGSARFGFGVDVP